MNRRGGHGKSSSPQNHQMDRPRCLENPNPPQRKSLTCNRESTGLLGLYLMLTQDCAALVLHPTNENLFVGTPAWATIYTPSGGKKRRRLHLQRVRFAGGQLIYGASWTEFFC